MILKIDKNIFGGLIAQLHHRHAPVPIGAMSGNYEDLRDKLDRLAMQSAKTACGQFMDRTRAYAKFDPTKRELFLKMASAHKNLQRQQNLSTGQGFLVDFVTIAQQALPEQNTRHFQPQSELLDFLSQLSTFNFPTDLKPKEQCKS